MLSIQRVRAMSEQQREIWFKYCRFLGIWGVWPVHWKGWALFFTAFPVAIAWVLICAATGLVLHPFAVLGPIAAYIIWLFIYMDRNAADK